MSNERTLRALMERGKVYVYLANESVGMRFLEQAEAEGLIFGDGARPTTRHYADVMTLTPDGTIHYVGTNGRIAFQSGADKIGNLPLIRIDYAAYLDRKEPSDCS